MPCDVKVRDIRARLDRWLKTTSENRIQVVVGLMMSLPCHIPKNVTNLVSQQSRPSSQREDHSRGLLLTAGLRWS